MPKSKYVAAKEKKASVVKSPGKTTKKIKIHKAKRAVSEYMQKHEKVWISELAENLDLDLGTLLPVLEELYQEGHIKKLKS